MPPPIQRKASISSPGDPLEREADEVADKVMRMAEPVPIGSTPVAVQRKCAACEDEENTTILREPTSSPKNGARMDVTAAVRATKQGGTPLPTEVRDYFEPRFGYDFSQVRVHADGQAAEAARAVHARAFTIGREVVFGDGQYAPATQEGRRLLAHELTHVVQQSQSGGSQPGPLVQRAPDETLEVLTTDEASFATEADMVRWAILAKALPKVQQTIEDVLTGSTGAVVDRYGRPKAGIPADIESDTVATLRAAHTFLHVRPSTFDWLNDPKDQETLDTLLTAARLMSENLAQLLPKRKSSVPDRRNPNTVARNDGTQIVLFPEFWVTTAEPYPSPLCHGIILLHEYFHHLVVNPAEAAAAPTRTRQVYHGEDALGAGFSVYSTAWSLSNAYSLTSFTVQVALGKLVECVPGWKPEPHELGYTPAPTGGK